MLCSFPSSAAWAKPNNGELGCLDRATCPIGVALGLLCRSCELEECDETVFCWKGSLNAIMIREGSRAGAIVDGEGFDTGSEDPGEVHRERDNVGNVVVYWND